MKKIPCAEIPSLDINNLTKEVRFSELKATIYGSSRKHWS